MEIPKTQVFTVAAKKQQVDQLSKEDQELLDSIIENVELITLKGNSYSKVFFSQFQDTLKNANNLKRLNINDIFVGRGKEEIPESLSILSQSLISKQILSVDLSNNAINPFGADALKPFLSQANNLKIFLVNNCGLGIQGVTHIAAGLKQGAHSLEILAIARNRAENEGAQQIALALNDLKKLKELHIYQNGIKEAGMIPLLDSLSQHCNQLELLDIRDNFIHLNTSPVLAHLISSVQTLKALNISDCNIEKGYNEHILNALESANLKLERLGYNYGELNDAQGLKLLEIISKSVEILQKVDIKGNDFKKSTKQKFRNLISKQNVLSAFDSDEEEENEQTLDELAKEFSQIHI